VGFCEDDGEHSDFIRKKRFLDKLSDTIFSRGTQFYDVSQNIKDENGKGREYIFVLLSSTA
jgi:hypothetical protein